MKHQAAKSKPTPQKARFDPARYLQTAAVGRTLSHYKAKDALFTQGDAADSVLWVKEGKVKISVVSDHGKEAIVAMIGPNEFIGEGCLIGQDKRLATATAVEKCTTMRVDKSAMLKVLKEEPKFSQMFMAHILTRVARVESDLVDQLFNSVERRLARTLLQMVDFSEESDTDEMVIGTISQETLASMIGTTRSHVSHFMNKFRAKGYVEYDNAGAGVKVHRSLLRALLNEAPPHLQKHMTEEILFPLSGKPLTGLPLDGEPLVGETERQKGRENVARMKAAE